MTDNQELELKKLELKAKLREGFQAAATVGVCSGALAGTFFTMLQHFKMAAIAAPVAAAGTGLFVAALEYCFHKYDLYKLNRPECS